MASDCIASGEAGNVRDGKDLKLLSAEVLADTLVCPFRGSEGEE